MHDLIRFFRGNPQALALLIICVVLGVGTFLAVVISLVGSGGSQVTGEPSGLIAPIAALLR